MIKWPPKIDIDGIASVWLLPFAKRQLNRFKKLFPFGVRNFHLPDGEEVTIWWGGMRERIRITAAGEWLFGIGTEFPVDETRFVLATMTGQDSAAPLIRLLPANIAGISADDRGTAYTLVNDPNVYRGGVSVFTFDTIPAQFANFYQGVLSDGNEMRTIVSETGELVSAPLQTATEWDTEVAPAPDPTGVWSSGKFLEWVVPALPAAPFYEEHDPGHPDVASDYSTATSAWDEARSRFYFEVASLSEAGTVRVYLPQVTVALWGHEFAADKIAVTVKILRAVGVTTLGSGQSRAWEVDLQPITVVYGYTLSTDAWVKLSEVLGEPYKRTIVDQTFLDGGAQPELNAVHIADGLPAVSLGFFVSSSMDFLEAHGDAVDGSWHIMRSRTTGAVSQTPSSRVLEEIETSPGVFDPLITIDDYATVTWGTLNPKFASLDGVQVSNIAGDPPETYGNTDALGRLEQLLHVAGNNAYFRMGSGNLHTWRYEGTSFVFGDVTLGVPIEMFISKDATRLHVSNPVSEEIEIWVAGVKQLTWPLVGVPAIGAVSSLDFPTYRANEEIIARVHGSSGTKTRVVRVTNASGSWEVVPGAYVPPSVNLSSGEMLFGFRFPARCVPRA